MIAQLIGIGVLWMRGALTVDRRAQFFAVLLDLAPKLDGDTFARQLQKLL